MSQILVCLLGGCVLCAGRLVPILRAQRMLCLSSISSYRIVYFTLGDCQKRFHFGMLNLFSTPSPSWVRWLCGIRLSCVCAPCALLHFHVVLLGARRCNRMCAIALAANDDDADADINGDCALVCETENIIYLFGVHELQKQAALHTAISLVCTQQC